MSNPRMLTAQSQAIFDRNGALPPDEDDPVAHARAQLPQWLGSLWVSTHCPALPQRVPGQT